MATTNTRFRLAASCPASTAEAQLYKVPANTQIDALLTICSASTITRNIFVAHKATTAATVQADYMIYKRQLSSYDTYQISISAGTSNAIAIAASVASKISFILAGNKKVTT